jgi:Fe2+ or Zn2+ uptake regulation protein
MTATVDSATRLRSANLRVTAPRLAVLAALPPGRHLDVETVAATARERLGTLSTQAVYDILRVLAAAGLVRRIQPAGGPARFEARAGDNHHHLVCRSCGATVDVDCAVGTPPCLSPSSAAGFTVDEAEVTFWGRCPDCQQTSTSSSPTEQRGSA